MSNRIYVDLDKEDLDQIADGKEYEFERLKDDGSHDSTIIIRGASNLHKHSCKGCHPEEEKAV